jgi:hypothetical protein
LRRDSEKAILDQSQSESPPKVVQRDGVSGRLTDAIAKLFEGIAGQGPFFPQDGSIKMRLWKILDCPETSTLSQWTSSVLIFVIGVSIVAYCPSTEPILNEAKGDLEPEPIGIFKTIETICVTIFTIEYLGKLFLCHAAPVDKQPVIDEKGHMQAAAGNSTHWENMKRTFDWFRAPMNIIDLLAILPYYIQLITDSMASEEGGSGGPNLSFVRVLRLTRIIRIFKVAKFSTSLMNLVSALRDSADELTALATPFLILLVVLASIIHYFEQQAYDGKLGYYLRLTIFNDGTQERSPFQSIPSSFWWVVVTMATVGYGDFFPTTLGGNCHYVLWYRYALVCGLHCLWSFQCTYCRRKGETLFDVVLPGGILDPQAR